PQLEHQDACLRRDLDAHGGRNLEPVRAGEALGSEETLAERTQALAVRLAQAAQEEPFGGRGAPERGVDRDGRRRAAAEPREHQSVESISPAATATRNRECRA